MSSRTALQILLDTCVDYGKEWCITYNPKKSKIMLFGKTNHCLPLKMYEKDLEVVNEYKYLGVTVVTGDSVAFSNIRSLRHFRSSANTILSAPVKSSEIVTIKLLYTICVPNLTYACEALHYSSRQFNDLNVALNDCFRKVFSYHRWESVRYLRQELGYPSLTEVFHSRTRKFHERMHFLRNDTLNFLNSLMLTDDEE